MAPLQEVVVRGCSLSRDSHRISRFPEYFIPGSKWWIKRDKKKKKKKKTYILHGRNSSKDTCRENKDLSYQLQHERSKGDSTDLDDKETEISGHKHRGFNLRVQHTQNWAYVHGEKPTYTHFLHPYKHASLFNEPQTHVNKMGEACFKRHPQYGRCPSSLSVTKTTPLIFLLSPCEDTHIMSVVPTLLHVLLYPRGLSPQCGPSPSAVKWPLSSQQDYFLSLQILLKLHFEAIAASRVIKTSMSKIREEVMVWMGPFVCSHPCASAIPLFSTLISHSLIIELRMTCGGDQTDRLSWNVTFTKTETGSHDSVKDLF